MFNFLFMLKRLLTLFLLFYSISNHLLQVLSVFRHGARYFLHDFYDATTEKEFWGQLTSVGMKHHETLGRMIRKDYIDQLKFLSSRYNNRQIEIYTTNLNRTFISGLSHMYGLYPLNNGEKMPEVDKQYHIPPFSSDIDASQPSFSLPSGHQTIPVVINASTLPLSCPLASQQMRKNQNKRLETYKEMNLTYFPFMKRMAKIFNFTTLNFTTMVNLYDTLLVDKYLGRPMPQTFTDDDYDNLQHLTYWYSHFTLTFNLSKAFNTLIMKRILEDFDDRIENLEKKPLKWTFLSAHDTNIYALNGDLNVSSSDCIEQLYRKGKTDALNCYPGPEFAANLIFQLHSDNMIDYYIQIRYNGEYVNLCEQKSTKCSYNEWKKRVKENIIIDYAYKICFGQGQATHENLKESYLDLSDLL